MNLPYTLGIDPGNAGGLALLNGAQEIDQLWRMPKRKGRIDWNELVSILQDIHSTYGVEVALEKQMPFTSKDRNNKSVVMAGTGIMLENYGRLKLCLEWSGLENYDEYYPAAWSAAYRQRQPRKRKGGQSPQEKIVEDNRSNKEKNAVIANGIWRGAAVLHGKLWNEGTRDAALIARYHQDLRRRKEIEQRAQR